MNMKCVYGDYIYTGKSIIKGSYLNFNGREISGISRDRSGEEIGSFAVVTPAFVDPHSHIGMVRSGEPEKEGEANENLDSIVALADALDSVQMDDRSFGDAVEFGVLYSCVVPGSGNIIGGLSAVIRNYAKNSTEALLSRAGIKSAFGYNPMSTQDWKGKRPSTRMGSLAELRKRLREVLQKMQKREKSREKQKENITFSPEEVVLKEILSGKQVLRAHVHKIDDISALLRLVDEFELRVTIDHAMDVYHPEIFRELKRRNIPVIYGPVDSFAYKVELKHESWRNVRHLLDSGVKYGLMTDHPVIPARQLLYQTRWFTRSGLSKERAIGIITRDNAEILGINNILGTLERGKWASFIGWNGDPFDITNYPVAVYGEGEPVYGY